MEDRGRETGSRGRPEPAEGRRRRELVKFYGVILLLLAGVWGLWGISYLWMEHHSEDEPTPASLVESAEEALSRGDAQGAGKDAGLARLLIESRLEDARGEEKADLLRLDERAKAIQAELSNDAAP